MYRDVFRVTVFEKYWQNLRYAILLRVDVVKLIYDECAHLWQSHCTVIATDNSMHNGAVKKKMKNARKVYITLFTMHCMLFLYIYISVYQWSVQYTVCAWSCHLE